MNKIVWSGTAGIVIGAVVMFVLMRGPLNQSTPDVTTREPLSIVAKQITSLSGKTREDDGRRKTDPQAGKAPVLSPESVSIPVADTEPAEELMAEEDQADLLTTVATDPDEIAAIVNGQPVGMNDILPPGVIDSGANLPEETYNGFLGQAVNQALLLQKALEMEVVNEDDMARIAESMRSDLAEIESSGSPDEIEWEVRNFTRMAVINELFTHEGLIPKMVGNDEVDEYYENHSDEYAWLREREAARGITDPEQIEIMVRVQVRQDLMIPLNREAGEKQKAYIETLRESADINFMK